MNKKELVAQLAKATGLSQAKTGEVVNALFDVDGKGLLVQAILAGDKVTIPGFGTFGAKMRAARKGVNPSTHEKMDIVSKRHVYFKVGKNLKELALK
jgi:DNA-binding protein HU-beta